MMPKNSAVSKFRAVGKKESSKNDGHTAFLRRRPLLAAVNVLFVIPLGLNIPLTNS